MERDERGLTLIEVLASITILSILGVIIWNVFLQGYKLSQRAVSKNSMIQETNLVITNLTRIHQKSTQYTLSNTGANCEITINYTKMDGTTQTEIYNNPQICFNFDITNSVTMPVNPKQNDVSLKITSSDKKNPSNNITINTMLYRIKAGGY
ncbi:prepilin-type N-terminal cleavage/methylation domain-containing protein [Bacillus salipaludis]|uniref:Prepilin-type N-terminal cleavage/methylation domain-containing protein n=1 Tax=Bacillus salipaludis TaxID=2547811 RepID=A0AA90TW88_9BACI|nr:prepilin-type N-terminal cleavage/methylation domain-containing protein [Bacillus salipaludis]MDQ6599833.1 prepilin-type N-terminal cleavage/methylation domain-containing protein [Bacillus salipaludis]